MTRAEGRGNILARARTLLGLTQEEMADAIGVSRRTYQRREKLADAFVPVGDAAAARASVYEKVDRALSAEAEKGGFILEWRGEK
jgi:transcriptional regulator with XRE-family HTH domain